MDNSLFKIKNKIFKINHFINPLILLLEYPLNQL